MNHPIPDHRFPPLTKRDKRRQLKTVVIVLTCGASLALGLAWHLLNH